MFLAALMYAIWSSMFPLTKAVLEYTSPLFLTGSRMVLAGVLLLGYLALKKRSSFALSKKQFLFLAILGFFSVYSSNALEAWGLQHLSAAKTCFIYSLSPFFAALFSYLHFKEKMNKRKWIGMGIGLIGFIPVLKMQTGSEGLLQAFTFFSWPELAVMGAAMTAIYGWVLLRVAVKDEISPTMANGMSMLIGGGMAFAHFYLVDSSSTSIAPGYESYFLKGTLLMTFISNVLCYNLYGILLKKYTATFLSFIGLLSPVFASLNAWIIIGELPSWEIFLSTAIVLTGLWIVYHAELKQGYILKKTPIPEG